MVSSNSCILAGLSSFLPSGPALLSSRVKARILNKTHESSAIMSGVAVSMYISLGVLFIMENMDLNSRYYAGLVLAPAKRTAHAWGFQTTGGAPRGMSAFLDDQKER